MKKKLLCLLLSLAMVMALVPLTALAETMPEEYRGSYKGSMRIDNKYHDVYFNITENQVTLSIPDYYYDKSFSLKEKDSDQWRFPDNMGNEFKINFDLELGIPFAYFRTTAFYNYSSSIDFIEKVSDSTGSTLSIGSDLIIPIGAAVLLIGVVVFMGKRKKAKTE